ncbi:putative CCG-binding protein [Helianthus debilis subsp. tardiflorus]
MKLQVSESQKEEVERVILESGDVKSLIGCLHGISAIHKAKKPSQNGSNVNNNNNMKQENTPAVEGGRACPVPDGLPKSREEMEEEEKGKPDSPFTILLRSKGRSPAWYSPAPDHEA